MRRFQREAKVLASLNHPNIGSIYGLEQSGETHHLVLELVPGETLAERISRGPIPVDEALAIAKSEREWSALPVTCPRQLRELLERCLRKDPKRRLHSAADARIAGETQMTWVNVDPAFDALRLDPRFQDLLRRMSFPD